MNGAYVATMWKPRPKYQTHDNGRNKVDSALLGSGSVLRQLNKQCVVVVEILSSRCFECCLQKCLEATA